jgi:hypothetical protein
VTGTCCVREEALEHCLSRAMPSARDRHLCSIYLELQAENELSFARDCDTPARVSQVGAAERIAAFKRESVSSVET